MQTAWRLNNQTLLFKITFHQVQSLATKIDLGNTFFMAIPSLIVAPFWGPWTDKTGRRKPALIAPTIGALLNTVVVLMVMYFEWPLYMLFVGSAISGVSGFLTTVMLATMSYIADTTEKSGIAIRLGKENKPNLISGSFLYFLVFKSRYCFIAHFCNAQVLEYSCSLRNTNSLYYYYLVVTSLHTAGVPEIWIGQSGFSGKNYTLLTSGVC